MAEQHVTFHPELPRCIWILGVAVTVLLSSHYESCIRKKAA
ncbi:MAG: hypothetical protein ACLUD0_06425 [Eubacterium ramulus]